jgi:NAD(P)-dependent dehydrogenase (short-subunit alcohol dehydrogenase family)
MSGAEGRVALVSGGSRGIGAAIAATLASRGWRLSFGVRRPEALALPGAPGQAAAFPYEARRPGSEAAWAAATAERFGRIDAVVASAGIMTPRSVVEASDEEIDEILDINVKSPLRLVRAAWPWLAAGGSGRVVMLVSLSGKRVKVARAGLYAVSKFAALALCHAVRHAGWDAGVRATAICPGFVATDMAARLSPLPLASMTQPADVAALVALLLDLPNTASIAEIPINCQLEEAY